MNVLAAPPGAGLPHGALRYKLGCRCLSCTTQWRARQAESRSLNPEHVDCLLREYAKRGAW